MSQNEWMKSIWGGTKLGIFIYLKFVINCFNDLWTPYFINYRLSNQFTFYTNRITWNKVLKCTL